jgi:ligand-binding sensor domain-containing protein/signal transduction histidine kinase
MIWECVGRLVSRTHIAFRVFKSEVIKSHFLRFLLGKDVVGKFAQMTWISRQIFKMPKRAGGWFIIFFLTLVFAQFTSATEKSALPAFLLRSWDSEDGLPSAKVRAVAQTADGYLWVATSHGLARFDGVRFVVHTTNDTPELGDNRMTCLLVTKSGDLLAGTEGGFLCRRHAGKFEAFPLPSGLQIGEVNAMAQDAEGAIWIASKGAGILRWRQGVWNLYTKKDGLPVNGATQLVVDKRGHVWAVSGGKLVIFEDNRWQMAEAFSSVQTPVLALARATDGGIWVGTSADNSGVMGSRIFKVKDRQSLGESAPYPWPQNTFHTQVRVLYEDATGRLWAALATAGVYYLEPGGRWQPLIPQEAFAQILVNCIAEDDAGNLWLGLGGAQLDQVRPRPVRTFHLPEEASQNIVRMACAARDGSVWVGTDGAGVLRYKDEKWTRYGVDEGLRNLFIGVIFEDSQTNLWVGTWNGFFQFENGRFVQVLNSPSSHLGVRALCEDHEHSLWLGTSVGVVRIKDGAAQLYPGDDRYSGHEVIAVAEDASGTIWAALTSRGLFRLNGERFEQVQRLPWPGQAEISSLLADPNGGLWLGSLDNGIAYLKDGDGKFWTAQDGLPSDMVFALIEDQEGNIWCGSDNGIIGCREYRMLTFQRGLSPPLLCRQLSLADGLDSRRCSGTGQPVASRSADGRLWFPNSHALAVFDPAELPQDKLLHKPLVEEVLVDRKRVQPSADGEVRVSSSAYSFEIHYTLPKLQIPERLRFRFQLVGSDSDWVEASQRRVAYYNHLRPGNYQFNVQVGSPGGQWQNLEHSLRLTVVPRVWERPLAQAAAGLFLLGAVAASVWAVGRARLRRRLERLEAQQAIERERRRIAQDLHDDLGGDLTKLMLLGDSLGEEARTVEDFKSQSAVISDNVRQLVRDMDQVVWTVNPENDFVADFADYLSNFAQEFLGQAGIQCRLDVMKGFPEVALPAQIRHNLFLASKEALHNVLKHSGATEAWVRILYANGKLMVSIEDNGRGFDPLATAGPTADGVGNMQQRLRMLGGTCDISSQAGRGTSIRLNMPVGVS